MKIFTLTWRLLVSINVLLLSACLPAVYGPQFTWCLCIFTTGAWLIGIFIAFISHYLVADGLRSGALQVVLPEFPIPELWVKATIPERRINAASVQALLQLLKRSLSPAHLEPQRS